MQRKFLWSIGYVLSTAILLSATTLWGAVTAPTTGSLWMTAMGPAYGPNNVFYSAPGGSGWQNVTSPTGFGQIAAAPNGNFVVGITTSPNILSARTGITASTPMGTGWQNFPAITLPA